MPPTKKINFSLMFSLKFSSFHLPIFVYLYRCVLKTAVHKLLQISMNECPLYVLLSLSNTDNVMWWLQISTLHSCSQHWYLFFCFPPNTLTSMSFYCSLFFVFICITSPMPSLVWNVHLHCILDKHTLFSIHFSDYPDLKFLHLLTKYLFPVNLLAVGSNVL